MQPAIFATKGTAKGSHSCMVMQWPSVHGRDVGAPEIVL